MGTKEFRDEHLEIEQITDFDNRLEIKNMILNRDLIGLLDYSLKLSKDLALTDDRDKNFKQLSSFHKEIGKIISSLQVIWGLEQLIRLKKKIITLSKVLFS